MMPISLGEVSVRTGTATEILPDQHVFSATLRKRGVACSENRVARLVRAAMVKSVRYSRRPKYKAGELRK